MAVHKHLSEDLTKVIGQKILLAARFQVIKQAIIPLSPGQMCGGEPQGCAATLLAVAGLQERGAIAEADALLLAAANGNMRVILDTFNRLDWGTYLAKAVLMANDREPEDVRKAAIRLLFTPV